MTIRTNYENDENGETFEYLYYTFKKKPDPFSLKLEGKGGQTKNMLMCAFFSLAASCVSFTILYLLTK